jgi:hypothetical protein
LSCGATSVEKSPPGGGLVVGAKVPPSSRSHWFGLALNVLLISLTPEAHAEWALLNRPAYVASAADTPSVIRRTYFPTATRKR